MMSPWKKLFMAVLMTTTVWLIVTLLSSFPSSPNHEPVAAAQTMKPRGVHEGDRRSMEFWRKLDLQYLSIPKEVKLRAKTVEIGEFTIELEGTKVFYRETQSKLNTIQHTSVLLLHGAAFSSSTWVDLGTLQLLAALGYNVVAVDIPGFGNSKNANIPDKAVFLYQLINILELKSPVIVSPSMSGNYAIPYIIRYWNSTGGFVPVSPVSTHLLGEDPCANQQITYGVFTDGTCGALRDLLRLPISNLSCLKVPTMVVYGEHDKGRNSAILCQFPWAQAVEIPQGKHPAYLDNPNLWHQILYNFIYQVNLMLAESNTA